MNQRFLLLCSLLVGLLGPVACTSPRHVASHLNRTDRNGRSQGKWRTYYDSAATQPFTAGRYRHGQPRGQFQYYSPTGALDHAEHYHRHGFCNVTYYYSSGKVARQGQAQWVTGPKGAARFYWFGPWTYYAENGQIKAIQTYTDGKHTATDIYIDGRHTGTEIFKDGKLVETRPVL